MGKSPDAPLFYGQSLLGRFLAVVGVLFTIFNRFITGRFRNTKGLICEGNALNGWFMGSLVSCGPEIWEFKALAGGSCKIKRYTLFAT